MQEYESNGEFANPELWLLYTVPDGIYYQVMVRCDQNEYYWQRLSEYLIKFIDVHMKVSVHSNIGTEAGKQKSKNNDSTEQHP